jgi:hypothetical protein
LEELVLFTRATLRVELVCVDNDTVLVDLDDNGARRIFESFWA